VDAATRLGGRWVLATSQSPGELAATVVWLVDGGLAREVARVPRAQADGRAPVRLAKRTDGHAVGLVVDGQPPSEHAARTRWIVSVGLESGVVGEPEPLAPEDLSDRAVTACKGDDAGWQVDLPYPGTMQLTVGAGWRSVVQSPVARMRLSRAGACVERVVGLVEPYAAVVPDAIVKPLRAPGAVPRDARAIEVAVLSARMRYALQCSAR
ncbi:MAG TPA: hypothetical protein VHS09_08670, partial [Polyangiaceae bacterium]|nr:hypothetical protein [Polyangiaceae bacterium]